MKYLITLLAVFVLIGCQTTDELPKNTSHTKSIINTQLEENKSFPISPKNKESRLEFFGSPKKISLRASPTIGEIRYFLLKTPRELC